jgi:hypothetical protein
MNEKIRQLAEQANWLFADKVTGEFTEYDKRIQKFAELIVRDCVAQCDKNKDHEWLGAGSKVSAFNIKQHFGVEE